MYLCTVAENRIPVGHIEINPLERLIRIGSLGATDAGTNLPGLVDVELVDHEDEDKQGTGMMFAVLSSHY